MPAQILVVDDESTPLSRLISQNFETQIRQQKYEFTYASDGEEAWDIIQQSCPDLMLLDILMPRLDGLTLLHRLHQSHINLKTIIISAYGTLENFKSAMQERAFDFLIKPLNRQELKQSVERVLLLQNEPIRIKEVVSDKKNKINKTHFSTVLRLAKELPSSQQYKLVSRLVENLPLEQIDDLQEDLPFLRTLAQEEEEEKEQLQQKDRERIAQGKIPLLLLEEGYLEERYQSYKQSSGEESQYRYFFIRWMDLETNRMRGRSIKKKDLEDPEVRKILERRLGKPLEN